MTHQEIITRLTMLYPSDAICSIITATVISAIVGRMAEEALALSAEDLELVRDEVRAAMGHHLDEREYIEMGLEAWEIIRNL